MKEEGEEDRRGKRQVCVVDGRGKRRKEKGGEVLGIEEKLIG